MTGETVGERYSGSVARSIHRAQLIADSGPRIQEYYRQEMSVEELEHWTEVVRNSSTHDDGDSHRLRVELRPLTDADVVLLFNAAMRPGPGQRWRFGGRTVPFPTFYDDLHTGALCIFGVAGVTDGHLRGAVVAYRHQLDLGHCFVAFIRTSVRHGSGEMAEGMFLLIEHLFGAFPLRKVYAEMSEPNSKFLGLPAGPFVEEGRFADHDFVDGRYVDHVHIAVERSQWLAFASPFRSWRDD